MASERASKKQQELLGFIDGFLREHGYAPSYREIMNGVGYKSVSTVAIHINSLVTKGYLSRGGDGSQRSLEVISLRPQSAPHDTTPDWKEQLYDHITKTSLDDEQRNIVNQALDLLGLTTDTTEEKGHDVRAT